MSLREHLDAGKENAESGIVYIAGCIAAHMTLDDATKIIILIMFSMRAAYDGLRLYRFLKQKDTK